MKRLVRLVASGSLKNGKFSFKNLRWVKGMMQQYEDCEVSVLFERKRKNRSKEQLAYLFGVVYPEISQHTGHSVEELHAVYKAKFLQRKIHWRGMDITVITSTSRLTSNEMSEFIGNIILDAGEMGISIPEPDKEAAILKTI